MNITINGTTYSVATVDDLFWFLYSLQKLQALARREAA